MSTSQYVVHELKQGDFYDFSTFLKNNYTWRANNTTGDRFEWKYVRWMRYMKEKPGILQYKLSHQLDEHFKELNINQRRRKNQHSPLIRSNSGDLPISLNKKRDLIQMLPLLNPNFHKFYHTLKAEGECEVEVDSDLDEIDNVE